MMKHPIRNRTSKVRLLWVILMTALLSLSAVACEEEVQEVGGAEDSAQNSLLVTPEFRIEGLEKVRGELLLQDLYLSVGEIRLEPLDPEHEGLVYVTRASFSLHFDLLRGEWVVSGAPIALPHPGKYLISITLESIDGAESGAGLDSKSMVLHGLMARTRGQNAVDTDKTSAGEPVPLPWRVMGGGDESEGAAPIAWVPWTYSSARTSFMILNDVNFMDEEDQRLVITFDISEWVEEAIAPIADAVKAYDLEEIDADRSTLDMDSVDVSDTVDRVGDGLEDFTESSEASVQ